MAAPSLHRLLFVADDEASFNTYKDSTFAMMREAARRGAQLWVCGPQQLSWQQQGCVVACGARQLQLSPEALASHYGQKLSDWYSVAQTADVPLREASAVLMRKDPPFDAEYLYATHLLGQAEREGAPVFNSPRALREHPEKLAILEFPQFIAPTLVTRSEADVRAFHAEQGDIILKPLDGMGGMGIFRVKADGLNLGAIIETLNRGGAQTLMVQRFLPAIAQGDKRILLIDGEPVSHVLARIPQGGEVRGNLAAGGKGVAQPLSDRDREIAQALGPVLAERGLLLVGLDVIGEHLTEINVTSPTCFQEISQQAGLDVAAQYLDALERRVAQASPKA
jgi:glutathione synthase